MYSAFALYALALAPSRCDEFCLEVWNYRVEGGGYAQLPRRTESTASPVECRGRRRWSWTPALESRTTHTAPSTADPHLSHPCSTFCYAPKPAHIAPVVPFERMAAHCSSLMRRTSIPIPHAVTSPAPPLHPLQPLQTTCHGAAKSAMTSCSRRGSSLHQSGHPHHICIRQALRQGTSARRQMASKASVVCFPDSVRLIQSVTVPAFSGAHA